MIKKSNKLKNLDMKLINKIKFFKIKFMIRFIKITSTRYRKRVFKNRLNVNY